MQAKRPTAWPSQQKIARLTGRATSTVKAALADLEREGWIQKIQSGYRGGQKSTNRYAASEPGIGRLSADSGRGGVSGIGRYAPGNRPVDGQEKADHRLRSFKEASEGPTASRASSVPEGECEGCGRLRALVDDARLHCAECVHDEGQAVA
jgi:DNA-binding transcriptional MocR family regulator